MKIETLLYEKMRSIAPCFMFIGISFFLSGCGNYMPENRYHAYSRSTLITNEEAESNVLSKASVEFIRDPELNNIRILQVSGSPYEMGFQQGRLLKEDVQKNLGRIYKRISFLVDPVVLDEIYALMEPYIPLEEKQEMIGLAHGADIPLRAVHRIHAIPELSEYKRNARFSRKEIQSTSCSNIAAFGSATADGEMYTMRILDWIRELGAQNYATITVYTPNKGNRFISFGYAGFIGCITGMNEHQLSFGEMGYGDRPEETLEGTPFVFLFKKLLRESKSIDDAIAITRNAPRTCSYAYLFADANKNDAALVVSNKDEMNIYRQNETLKDEDSHFPAINQIVYGGAKDEELYTELKRTYGTLDAKLMQEIAGPISLQSNMQVVIMKPKTYDVWIANAADSGFLNSKSDEGRACNQKYYHINFENYLKPN